MRSLLLLRHASAGQADDDRERPLDPRGQGEARGLSARLSATGATPERVLCSPARRARDTLEPLRAQLSAAQVEMDEILYLASPGGILGRVQELDDDTTCALIVGHNPGLASLARGLAGAGDPEALQRAGRFPPATLAHLVFDAARWCDLAPGRGRLAALSFPGDPS
jgi:phosphohistidine phosphatase